MFGKSATANPPQLQKEPSIPPADAACAYSSEVLFQGQKEIRIDHQGAAYRLRITRTGGLILNK